MVIRICNRTNTQRLLLHLTYDLGREISYYTVLKEKGPYIYKQILLWRPTKNFIYMEIISRENKINMSTLLQFD